MDVVRPEHRLDGQGLCFICEKAIDHPREAALRTGHDFDPMFHTPLVGDKYLCQGCAENAAAALGWISPENAGALKHDAETARVRLGQFQELAGALTGELPVRALPVAVTATKEKSNGSKA